MAKRLTHTPNCSMHTHSHSTNPLICSSPIVPDFRVAYCLTLPDSIPITWPSLMGSVTTHPQAFTIIIPLTFLLICQPFSHSLLCHRFISFLVHQYHFIILGGFEKDQGKVYVKSAMFNPKSSFLFHILFCFSLHKHLVTLCSETPCMHSHSPNPFHQTYSFLLIRTQMFRKHLKFILSEIS